MARDRRTALVAPQLARAIVVAVFCGFCLAAFLHILYLGQGFLRVLLATLCIIALLGIQLLFFNRPVSRLRTPAGYAALAAQAGLVYLPLLQFKGAWVGLPSFLAGSVLLVLPAALGWVAFAAVVASMGFVQAWITGSALDIAYTTLSTFVVGLVVYGMSRLAGLVNEVHAARSELAKMAVAQERLRFARDLHDLLGYSLSAITLKSELTHRLLAKQPTMAEEQLSEILDISRKALADVRTVAHGYRELSLDSEADSARSVLLAADVQVRMDLHYDELPRRVGTVLATVLREGVTNILRHSKAERCDITVRQSDHQVRIDIVNDGGAQDDPEDVLRGGSGIHNLSVRVSALGGKLAAGLDHDGLFRLHAVVPLTDE
jgi:two-component system, NarL family, sensor histidine kinase DesK